MDIQAAHLARALEERDSWLQQKGTLEQQLQDQGRLAEEAREADQERAQRLRDTVAELEQTVAGCQSRLSEQAGVMAKLEAELASAHEARDTALAEQVRVCLTAYACHRMLKGRKIEREGSEHLLYSRVPYVKIWVNGPFDAKSRSYVG